MISIDVRYEDSIAQAKGADLDQALARGVGLLAQQRGKEEVFVVLGSEKNIASPEHAVRMSYKEDGSDQWANIYALDLKRHYSGALETVRVVANLEFGFAGKTRHAMEECVTYAIGVGRHLSQQSGQPVNFSADLKNILKGSLWGRLVDVDGLILGRSG
ncbi:hypothetical protein [Rhizobium sp. GR12]|uniref:hypothetical protein n=1 Tax=Rhizobium sp. GR12 TaxID=3053925 RepID=UPI002FBDFA44